MNIRRSYTMSVRAQSVEQTRARILEAAFAASADTPIPALTLERIARDAGVSVQTVLRQFGSKAALVEATIDWASQRVAKEREAPPGDVTRALRVLVDHYERRGRGVLLMLGQEFTEPEVAKATQAGRHVHRRWVHDVFGPLVGGREDTIDLLVVATDVYVWKMLRLDRGLSRAETEHRIRGLVDAVLATSSRASDEPQHMSGSTKEGRDG